MNVIAINAAASRLTGFEPRRCDRKPAENVAPDHALVAVAQPRATGTLSARGRAAFLAQLIAAKQQLPQARARRRAEPVEASHAYTAALAEKPLATGRVFSRST